MCARTPSGDQSEVALDDVGHQPDEIDVDHGDDRRVRRDVRPGIQIPASDEPVDRRQQDGVLQVDPELREPRPGFVELRAGQIELRLGGLEPRLRIVELLARHELAGKEARGSLTGARGEDEVGLPLPHRRPRDLVRGLPLAQLLLELVVLHAAHHLPLGDRVAEAHRDLAQPAVYLRRHLDRCGADQVADQLEPLLDVGARYLRSLDEHRLRPEAPPAGGSTAGATAARPHLAGRSSGDDALIDEHPCRTYGHEKKRGEVPGCHGERLRRLPDSYLPRAQTVYALLPSAPGSPPSVMVRCQASDPWTATEEETMTRTRPLAVLSLLTAVLLAAAPAYADVVRIVVDSRADVAGGAYGLAGPYETLAGMVHFEVDPANPANRIVSDIEFAPRNERGRVEFRSNFFLLKPKDIGRGNGTVLYEVSNRGGKGMLGYFNNAAGSRDPQTAEEMGDGFLLENGFSLLWLGWQFDVPVRDGQMRLHTPVASDGGNPLTGLVRSEVIVNERAHDRSLADRNHIAYAVADPDDARNVLTVRDGVDQPRRVIPRERWRFARRDDDGSVVADRTRVHLEGGFEPHKIYDVVYVARDPALVGLGPAAVRDLIAQMKYEASPEIGLPAGAIEHAIAWGVSQSGRFLRTFLYHGFNADEQGRRAFDGVMAHVAGGGRGSFNHRFAQPSRDGHPFLNKLYPSDIFPFTGVTQHDPETDMRDGLLAGIQPGHMPKVFYTNSSYEYWGRAASLIHTTLDGAADAPLLDNVRIYSFAGGQHGPGRFPAAAHDRPAVEQPERLLLVPAPATAGDGPLDRRRRGDTAAQRLPAAGGRRPRAARATWASRSCRASVSRPCRTWPTGRSTGRSSGRGASPRCSRRRCSPRSRSWCRGSTATATRPEGS